MDAKTPCAACASSTYRSGDAAPENNICKQVPSGYKLTDTTRTAIALCAKGTVSFYTSGVRTPTSETACESCATVKANSYAPRAGMAACTPCKGGFVPATSVGAAGPDTCAACGNGLFRNAFTVSATCAACGQGNEVGPSSRQACTQCRPGSFLGAAEVATNNNTCSQCPVSVPAALPACLPAFQPTTCLPAPYVPNLHVCAAAALLLRQRADQCCPPCPVLLLLQQHSFSAAPGAKACTACPKGQETQDTGNSECSPCAKGYYNSVSGTSCDAAPAGTFVNTTAAVVFTAW